MAEKDINTASASEEATSKQRELIKELVKAKLINPLPLEEWKTLSKTQAHEIISAAPRLNARQHDIATEESKSASVKQMVQISRMVKEGRIEPIPSEQWKQLTREEAAKIISNGPDQTETTGKESTTALGPASVKQMAQISRMVKEGRIEPIPSEQWKQLTREEAAKIISENPGRDNQQEPATSEQKKAISQLVHDTLDNAITEFSEKINNHWGYLDNPHTPEQPDPFPQAMIPEQREAISILVKTGVIPELSKDEFRNMNGKEAHDIIWKSSKTLHNDLHTEIPLEKWNSLTKEKATRIISSGPDQTVEATGKEPVKTPEPASAKQKECISRLVEEGKTERIPREEWNVLTKLQAHDIISRANSPDKSPSQETITREPATAKQLNRIVTMSEAGYLSIDREKLESLSKNQAQRMIAAGKQRMSQTPSIN